MDRKIGLSWSFARASASGPQGNQSTGLDWCCSRYGDVSPASRFGMRSSFRSPSMSGVNFAIFFAAQRRGLQSLSRALVAIERLAELFVHDRLDIRPVFQFGQRQRVGPRFQKYLIVGGRRGRVEKVR